MYRDTFLLLGFFRFLGFRANRQFQDIRNYRLFCHSTEIIFYRVDTISVNLAHGQQHSLTLCWVYQAIIQAMAVRWTGDHQSVGILLDGARMELGLVYELSRQAIRQGGRCTESPTVFPIAFSKFHALVVNQVNATYVGHADWYQSVAFEDSNTQFSWYSYYFDGSVHWIAVGVQTGWIQLWVYNLPDSFLFLFIGSHSGEAVRRRV